MLMSAASAAASSAAAVASLPWVVLEDAAAIGSAPLPDVSNRLALRSCRRAAARHGTRPVIVIAAAPPRLACRAHRGAHAHAPDVGVSRVRLLHRGRDVDARRPLVVCDRSSLQWPLDLSRSARPAPPRDNSRPVGGMSGCWSWPALSSAGPVMRRSHVGWRTHCCRPRRVFRFVSFHSMPTVGVGWPSICRSSSPAGKRTLSQLRSAAPTAALAVRASRSWHHHTANGLCFLSRYPIRDSSVMDRTALEALRNSAAGDRRFG